MKIKANKILAVVCVIAMIMTMIVPMTMTASAEEITASKTMTELINEYGWTSSTTKQSFNLDNNVSVKINGGNNTGKAYNGNHIRVYATDTPAGTITISVPDGYELVSINISTQTGTYAFLCLDGTTTDISNVETAVSGQSVLLTSVKNGTNGKQVRVTAMEVVYQPVGGGETPACTHENETEVVEVPATCTEDGSYTFVCGDCGETVSKVLSATGHNYVDNTCTVCGAYEYTPMTIEEALEAADGTKVMLTGVVVVEVGVWNTNYNDMTLTVEDPETGNTLYFYNFKTKVELGDILTVKGTMGTYNNTRQLAQGGTGVITGKTEIELPDPVEVTLAEAAALEDGTLVLVKGVVTNIDYAWNSNNQNMSVTITDTNGDTLYIYKLATEVALGDTIAVTGKMGTYNGRQIAAGSTAVVEKASVLPQLNAVNAHMSVAYKYVEDGTTLSDSQFVLKCGVDAGLASIEGVTSYGIAVTAGNMTVYYTSDTATSWTVGNDVISVAINLGDIINDQDKLGTEFTVSAFVVADGITWESTSAKTYSVAGMIDEYTTQGIEDVEHLYNILVGYGLV